MNNQHGDQEPRVRVVLTPDAQSELDSLLQSKASQEFVERVETTGSGLRSMITKVAAQTANERGTEVRKADIDDSWEKISEWGDLNLWKRELKVAIEKARQNGT